MNGPINASLTLALKPNDAHAGSVVPAAQVFLIQFQAELAATREQWRIDET